jgi:DNA-3-methyladenine glycosylase II
VSPHPSPDQIAAARRRLAARDPVMARIDARVPPFAWRSHPSGFATLVRMVVDQQVSRASAAALWAKLEAGLGEVTPERVLAHSEEDLRGMAMSRQKARYLRAIAEAGIDFAALSELPEDEAEKRLTAITGIGRWTAEVYLLMCEGRPDAFPAADLALQEAMRAAEARPERPSERALRARAEPWRPWRGVAAHLLWAFYRLERGRPPP